MIFGLKVMSFPWPISVEFRPRELGFSVEFPWTELHGLVIKKLVEILFWQTLVETSCKEARGFILRM